MEKRNVTHYSVPKKALSFFLAFLMILTAVAVGIVPLGSLKVKATSGGTYYIKIEVQCTNATDNDWSSNNTYLHLYGKDQNGASCSTNINGIGNSSGDNWFTFYGSMSGYPTGFDLYISNYYWGQTRLFLRRVYVSSDNSTWQTLLECDIGCNKANKVGSQTAKASFNMVTGGTGSPNNNVSWSDKGTDVYQNVTVNNTTNYYNSSHDSLYISSAALSGDSTVYTNGSTTKNYTIGSFKDAVGVAWYDSTVYSSYFSEDHAATSVSYTSPNLTGTVTFGNNSGVDYTVQIHGRIDNYSWSPYVHAYKDVTVYTTHTLNYDLNGGSCSSSSATGYTGTTVNLPTPTKTGYTFSGWTLTSGSGTLGGNTSNGTSNQTYTFANEGSATVKANWSVNNYYLDVNGWIYTADNTGASNGGLDGKATANVTVNGSLVGNGVGDYWTQHPYGSSYTITVTPAAGWKLDGIHSGPTTPTTSNDNNVTVSGTIPANNIGYAFNVRPKVIKLTLNNQSATTAGTAAVYYKYAQNAAQDTSNTSTTGTYFTSGNNTNNTVTGKISSITIPTKTGYDFGGYYTAQNGGGTRYIDENGAFVNNAYNTLTADTTLYAKWSGKSVNVTLNKQDGTGGLSNVYFRYNTNKYYSGSDMTGEITNIADGKPSRTGYTFGGYYTQTNGGGTQYIDADGNFVNNLYAAYYTDQTLYAKWTANKRPPAVRSIIPLPALPPERGTRPVRTSSCGQDGPRTPIRSTSTPTSRKTLWLRTV